MGTRIVGIASQFARLGDVFGMGRWPTVAVLMLGCGQPVRMDHAAATATVAIAPADGSTARGWSGRRRGMFSPIAKLPGAFRVDGIGPVKRVSVAPEVTCAATASGWVWCWAEGEWPRVLSGAGDVRDVSGRCTLAEQVRCAEGPKPPTMRDVRALSKERPGCAVVEGGKVTCWSEPTAMDSASLYPFVPDVAAAQTVVVARFGACAIQHRGALVCWGAPSLIPWAPLGRRYQPPPPTPPHRLRGIDDVVDVSLDGGPCLVRRTGEVHCWFPDDAPMWFPRNPLSIGSKVHGIRDAIAVSSDMVLHADGTVTRLEVALDATEATPFRQTRFGGEVLSDVASVAGSTARGCARTTAGDLICWGDIVPETAL